MLPGCTRNSQRGQELNINDLFMQKETELHAKPSSPGWCEKTWGRGTTLEDSPRPSPTALEMVNLHTTCFIAWAVNKDGGLAMMTV